AEDEAEADGDGNGLQRMVLHEAASVAHPRPGVAAGVTLDHLLGALLRVGAGAGRRGLGVTGDPAGAALGGVSDALEASLLHTSLLLQGLRVPPGATSMPSGARGARARSPGAAPAM